MPAIPKRTPLRLAAPPSLPPTWSPRYNPHGGLAERGEGIGHNAVQWGQPLQRAPQEQRAPAGQLWRLAGQPGYFMKNYEQALAPLSHGPLPSYHAAYPQAVSAMPSPHHASHSARTTEPSCKDCDLYAAGSPTSQGGPLLSQPSRYAPRPLTWQQPQPSFQQPNDTVAAPAPPPLLEGVSNQSSRATSGEVVFHMDRRMLEVAAIIGGLAFLLLLGFAVKGVIDVVVE